jgi:hypothetical protein
MAVAAARSLLVHVLDLDETSHVFSFLWSRIGLAPPDFDTLLYACASSFEPVSGAQVGYFLESLLGVGAILGATLVVARAARCPDRQSAGGLLLVLVALGYVLMGALVNRFVILGGTYLAALGGLPFSQRLWSESIGRIEGLRKHTEALRALAALWMVVAAVVLLAVGMPRVQSYARVVHPRGINPHEAEMMRWIEENTAPDAVIAASMGYSPAIYLRAGRRTVVHPHYEHAELRRKVRDIYAMYGMATAEELHRVLSGYGVDYVLLDFPSLVPITDAPPGCRNSEIVMRIESEAGATGTSFWESDPQNTEYFDEVYGNLFGRLLRVNPADPGGSPAEPRAKPQH